MPAPGRRSAVLDTRIICCGDCLDRLRKLPDGSVELIYIRPPFNNSRNHEVFWGEAEEKRAIEHWRTSTEGHAGDTRHGCPEVASAHGPRPSIAGAPRDRMCIRLE